MPTRNQAAIGSAVLDVINDEKLMNNAKEVGEFMMESIKVKVGRKYGSWIHATFLCKKKAENFSV